VSGDGYGDILPPAAHKPSKAGVKQLPLSVSTCVIRNGKQAFTSENAPDAVAAEVRQEMRHHEGQVVESEVRALPQYV
jgi:hypothetical protein